MNKSSLSPRDQLRREVLVRSGSREFHRRRSSNVEGVPMTEGSTTPVGLASSAPDSTSPIAVAVAASAGNTCSIDVAYQTEPSLDINTSISNGHTNNIPTSATTFAVDDMHINLGSMDSFGTYPEFANLNRQSSESNASPLHRPRTHTSPEISSSLSDSYPNTPGSPSTVHDNHFMHKSNSDVILDGSDPHNTDTNTLTPRDSAKVAKKESLRIQKKAYRQEKKKAAQEIMTTLNDPSVEMIANFLKVRSTLKSWTKLYCVLKPGLLVLYRSQKTNKSGQWVGTVLLNCCQLIERPSKKDGFCFKVFHPLEQSIWALKGPHGESTSLIGLNLPSGYLIFRALSDADGKCWMDHMELTMKIAPAKLKSSMIDSSDQVVLNQYDEDSPDEAEIEKIHFQDPNCEDDNLGGGSETDGAPELMNSSSNTIDLHQIKETAYVLAPHEDFGALGAGEGQSEAVPAENKSLMFTLLKQLKPGMDLSKIVLPTFILEPRSFLDKLSDYYCHCDLLAPVIQEDDPFERMKSVAIFFLSGFYKKPKGLKKPYNPIIGEYFRCHWEHPNGSRTFYIAEQVSHHPPISVFHVSNRAAGFAISGTILAKSKFYGTSVAAIFEGNAKLTLLSKGEDYEMNFPYAYAKGFLYGTVSMELGGKVSINCEKTGYSTEIEFKLKPYFGGKNSINAISGQIKLGKKVLASIDGKWDGDIYFTDNRKEFSEPERIWTVNEATVARRLPRKIVDFIHQDPFESEKLWKKVGDAISIGDQQVATDEKFILEERQRTEAKERLKTNDSIKTKFFKRDEMDDRGFNFVYKHADFRPWDKDNDMMQYESLGIIKTLSKHKIAPLIRAHSSQLISPTHRSKLQDDRYKSSLDTTAEGDESSNGEAWLDSVSDTAETRHSPTRRRHGPSSNRTQRGSDTTKNMAELVEENTKLLKRLQIELKNSEQQRSNLWSLLAVVLALAMAFFVQSFWSSPYFR